MVKTSVFSVRFVLCPTCQGSRHEVESLFGDAPRDAGPWRCDDCGESFHLRVMPDGTVETKPAREHVKRPLVVLEIPPQKEPIRFLVRAREFGTVDGFDPQDLLNERHAFFFEEHTCPTNWLSEVEQISIGDDKDPHGLAVFVERLPDGTEVDK